MIPRLQLAHGSWGQQDVTFACTIICHLMFLWQLFSQTMMCSIGVRAMAERGHSASGLLNGHWKKAPALCHAYASLGSRSLRHCSKFTGSREHHPPTSRPAHCRGRKKRCNRGDASVWVMRHVMAQQSGTREAGAAHKPSVLHVTHLQSSSTFPGPYPSSHKRRATMNPPRDLPQLCVCLGIVLEEGLLIHSVLLSKRPVQGRFQTRRAMVC